MLAWNRIPAILLFPASVLFFCLIGMSVVRCGLMSLLYCIYQVLRPMVRIARQVIARNGYSEVIQIVPKRSTEMTSGDMPTRANILVTEVFDTELIGEGALVTFAHAHKHLLEVITNVLLVNTLY